jgi:uncharacterized membrane protein HdeD (DUF308 family)
MEEIHYISSVFIFAASIIPIYLSFKLKNRLRVLTILLGVFAIFHAIYHVVYAVGIETFGEEILQPISITILILFGVTYLKIRKNRDGIQK